MAHTVAGGRPDEVHGVGAAFRTAQTRALEVARLGGVADRSTAVAYTNNGAGVWEVDAAARQTHGLLSQNGDDMADVGRAVIIVAEELASASSAVQKELTTLADQINGVLARRNAFFASAGPLAPEDLAAAERGFVDQAVGLVRGCAGRIQADLDAYDRVLASRTGFLADLGYEPLTAEAGPPVDRNATTTLAPGLIGSEVLRTPPGARLEGGLDPGVTITVPAPGGGLVLGTPPAPDLGTGQTDRGMFPFPVPDGSRVLSTDGAGQSGEGNETGTPVIEEGKQTRHIPGDPNFQPGRSILTGDADELIQRAGSGEQVGAVSVGEPGSKERIDFGHEIGINVDRDGNETPTTVGIIHYSKNGAHIVPGRPR